VDIQCAVPCICSALDSDFYQEISKTKIAKNTASRDVDAVNSVQEISMNETRASPIKV
jgi:hypothetical protein